MFKRVLTFGLLLVINLSILVLGTNTVHAWSINDAPIAYTLLTLEGSPNARINGNFLRTEGVDFDSQGNVYVLDNAGRITKYTSTYTFVSSFSTIVGNEQTSAPVDIAINSQNKIYVSDGGNIKIFNTNGTFIQYLVEHSNGQNITIDGDDNIFVGEYRGDSQFSDITMYNNNNEYVKTLDTISYNGKGMTVDSEGNLFYLRTQYMQYDKVYLVKYFVGYDFESEITRLFNVTNNGLLNTLNIEIDSSDMLYIVGNGPSTNKILKYTRGGSLINSFASEGTGVGQLHTGSVGTDIGILGTKLLATDDFHCIQEFTTDGDYVKQFGNFGPLNATITNPIVAKQHSNGQYFILSDENGDNNTITVLSQTGAFVRNITLGVTPEPAATSGDSTPFNAEWMTLDAAGNIYVSDTQNRLVRKLNNAGTVLYTLTGTAADYEASSSKYRVQESTSEVEQIHLPRAIAVKSTGKVYVANDKDIVVLNSDGTYSKTITHDFQWIAQISFDSNDHLYVVDKETSLISSFDENDEFLLSFGNTGEEPGSFEDESIEGIAVDSSGFIYVSNTVKDTIQVFNPEGIYVKSFGSNSAEEGALYTPYGLNFNNEQSLIISDTADSDEPKHSVLLMVFDRVAPTLNIEKVSTSKVTGSALDSLTAINAVTIKLDSGSWNNCTATDGQFNSKNEKFTCSISQTGAKMLTIKATDSKQNTITKSAKTVAITAGNGTTSSVVKPAEQSTLLIVDENNKPISGAKVVIDNEEYLSDADGLIYLSSLKAESLALIEFDGKKYESKVELLAESENGRIQLTLSNNQTGIVQTTTPTPTEKDTRLAVAAEKQSIPWYLYLLVILVIAGLFYYSFNKKK